MKTAALNIFLSSVEFIKLFIAENCIWSKYNTLTSFSFEIHNFQKTNQYMCMGVKKENEVLVSISLASIILLAFSIPSMALRQFFSPSVKPCFKHSWPSCQTVAHDVWTLRHQEKLQHLKGFTLVSCISLMNIKNMPKKFHDCALHS